MYERKKKVKDPLLRFVKKYLRGCGLRNTEKNIKNVIDFMNCEGVVFE